MRKIELDKKLDLSVQKTRNILRYLTIFIIFSGLVNIFLLLKIPADQKNALILGFSLKRFSVLIFLLAGTISFIFAGIYISRTTSHKIKKISDTIQGRWISALILSLFFITIILVWVTGFSPEYLLNGYFEIGRRLLPVFRLVIYHLGLRDRIPFFL